MRTITAAIVVTLLALPGVANAQSRQTSFSDFKKIAGQDVAIVDQDGVERIGNATSMTDGRLTIAFPSGPQTFDRAAISRIERMHDHNIDGFIKGAGIALLITILAAPGYDSGSTAVYATAYTMALFGGVGYVFDRMSDNRQLVYQVARVKF